MFLSKSAGYEHRCIAWTGDRSSHVDRVLRLLGKRLDMEILCTKDARRINTAELAKHEVVLFYTTGDLTTTEGDGQPAMRLEAVDELLAWIRGGGGFVGFHSTTITFRTPEGVPATPFLEMLGGEFRIHGAPFEGIVRVVDPEHPTMANVPSPWTVHDEWYLFRKFNTRAMHVLALLDPGAEGERQELYRVPAYPIAWCSAHGKGRVFYNAMGHFEELWDDPTYQQHVVDAIRWAKGEGLTAAPPNFSQFMSDADAAAAQGVRSNPGE